LIHFYKRNNRLNQLNNSLKEAVENASDEGVSVTEWKMLKRLKRNQEMLETMEKEMNRVQARRITSPTEQKRRQLLDQYLDMVHERLVVNNP